MRNSAFALILILTACATTTIMDKVKVSDGYYMKGLSHLQNKNYELALVEFQRSIQTDDKNIKSLYALGIISDSQGKLQDAEKYYKTVLAIDSHYSEAYNALGTVYSKQERWQDALDAFHKALENKLYTTPHLTYLNMARTYMAQKNYEKAIAAYRESKFFANYDLTMYELGTALFEDGRTMEAIREFQEGVSLAPNNVNIRYGLALALLKEGNKKAALAEFNKTIELAPQSDLARKARDFITTLR